MTNKKYYLYEMNLTILNVISGILMAALVLVTFLLVDFGSLIGKSSFDITFLLLIPYLILHEFLHSISYVIHGASFKNITYGAHLEKGILCCLCKQNVTRKNILISLLYPFFWIGVVTYIIGIATNNAVFIMLSIFNISGCAGDLIMFLAFLKLRDFEYSEYDNPTAFGLYSSNDLSNTKLFGLKYIGCQEELEKKDLKKISISKESIIGFFLFIIFVIVYIIV